MASAPRTLGEIGRKLDELSSEQREFRAEVKEQLAGLDDRFIRVDVAAERANVQALIAADYERRIKGLEDWRDWVIRIVIGAVLLAVLGVVLVQSGATP